MPRLEKENEIPLSLFLLVRDQNIMSDSSPVALKIEVARSEIARVLKDKHEQDICLNRILAAHQRMLKIIREEREAQIGKNR